MQGQIKTFSTRLTHHWQLIGKKNKPQKMVWYFYTHIHVDKNLQKLIKRTIYN